MNIIIRSFYVAIAMVYYSFKARFVLRRLKKNPEKYKDIYTEEYCYGINKGFGNVFVKTSGYNISVIHSKRLDDLKNTIIVSNHASVLEPLLLPLYIPTRLLGISKKELQDEFWVGPLTRTAKSISIDRNDPLQTSISLFKALKAFKQGKTIIVFPEGTRSNSETMLPFKEDVFKFAKILKADILPIKVSYRLNKKNLDGTKNNKLKIIVNEKISFESIKKLKPEEITKMVFNIMEKNI